MVFRAVAPRIRPPARNRSHEARVEFGRLTSPETDADSGLELLEEAVLIEFVGEHPG